MSLYVWIGISVLMAANSFVLALSSVSTLLDRERSVEAVGAQIDLLRLPVGADGALRLRVGLEGAVAALALVALIAGERNLIMLGGAAATLLWLGLGSAVAVLRRRGGIGLACACFGASSSSTVGSMEVLVRLGLLVVAATVAFLSAALVSGEPPALEWRVAIVVVTGFCGVKAVEFSSRAPRPVKVGV